MKDTTLYQKIKKLIEISEESKFISYDERLNLDKTYPKPRKTWEIVHTVKINDGNFSPSFAILDIPFILSPVSSLNLLI